MTRLQATALSLLVVLVITLLLPRPTVAQENGIIDGTVVNGTAGAPPPADAEVVVHILQNRNKVGERRIRTDASGSFRVEGLAIGPDMLYFPIVQYAGVPYYPTRPVVLDGPTPAQTEITVFEGTPSTEAVSFERLNMLVMGVTPTALTIMEMGAIVNGSDRTFAADPQVTGSARTLRFLLPPGAIDVAPQAGLPADTLETMPDGFATTDPVRPGRREIAFSYDLPYTTASLDLTRSFALPVGTFTLYVPNDIGAVVSDAVALPGLADLGGRQFRQYAVQQVVPGAEIRLRLTGLPAPFFAKPLDLALAVVGGAGAVLLTCLVITLLRHRRRDQPTPVLADPTARLALIESMARLDERFAAGELDEDSYHAERTERKARLLALTRVPANAS